VEYNGAKIGRTTLSMGTTLANHAENAEQLIKRADLAMYAAKQRGGDQLAISPDNGDSPG
jgi:GGDEF domain-containing protein